MLKAKELTNEQYAAAVDVLRNAKLTRKEKTSGWHGLLRKDTGEVLIAFGSEHTMELVISLIDSITLLRNERKLEAGLGVDATFEIRDSAVRTIAIDGRELTGVSSAQIIIEPFSLPKLVVNFLVRSFKSSYTTEDTKTSADVATIPNGDVHV